MRNMGWREGQGIGPRISYQQRKRQASEIGIKLSEEADEEEHEGEAGKHLYAPLDRPLILVKGNTASTEKGWGLGYQPGSTLNAQLKKEGVATSDGRRLVGGYGVEEDPYGDDDDSGNFARVGSGAKKAMSVLDDLDEDEGEYRIAGSSRGHTFKKVSCVLSFRTLSLRKGSPSSPLRSRQQGKSHQPMSSMMVHQFCPASRFNTKPVILLRRECRL